MTMPDERLMSPGERAAYANGWAARDAEVEQLKQELLLVLRELGKWSPVGLRDGK
jgi:hypothetical protein